MRTLAAFLLLCVPIMADDLITDLQELSVTIKAGQSQGSGTIFTRDGVSYCWTAAHVVDGLRKVRHVIVNGSDKTVVEFEDARIVQEFREAGRRIGEVNMDAEVIRFSDADNGEDLALLRIRKRGFSAKSVVFHDDDAPLPLGTDLLHVGSLLGQVGANSLTQGIVSQIGRVVDVGATGKVFDQTTVTAFPGSSGGGVFLKSNGRYVGMLVRGAGEQFNLTVPIRRMRAWAKSAGVEWAIDKNVPMPSEDELKKLPVEDAGVEFQAAREGANRRDYSFLLHREGDR